MAEHRKNRLYRVATTAEEILRRTGLLQINNSYTPRGSIMLKDPIFEDVKILLLSPYAIEEFAMADLGGEDPKSASEIKARLEWMVIYRDAERILKSKTVYWANLVDEVVDLNARLLEDIELNDQLKSARAVEDSQEVPEESLVDVSPFSGVTLYP